MPESKGEPALVHRPGAAGDRRLRARSPLWLLGRGAWVLTPLAPDVPVLLQTFEVR
jgi:hypothetical protein